MSRIRKTAALVSATALLGGGGIGAAQAASSSSSGSHGHPAGHRGGGPASSTQLAAIAKRLGVTSAELRAALDASRPQRPNGGDRRDGARGDGVRGDRTAKTDAARRAKHAEREAALYAAIAKELGLKRDAVKAAFEANRPAMPARSVG